MMTATLGTDLRTELLTKALAWIEANPERLIDFEWALRSDVEPAPMRDDYSLPALICVMAGLELGWGPVAIGDPEVFWPPQVTHSASTVYDPSSMRWDHVATVARHILGLDSQEATDLFELSDTADIVTAIRNLMNGEN